MRQGGVRRNLLHSILALVFVVAIFAPGLLKAQSPNLYTQVNLVSDGYVKAMIKDPHLINPWGIANGPKTPIWMADQGTSTSTLYNIDNLAAGSPFVVHFPTEGSGMQGPTGIVYNPAQSLGDFRIPAPNGRIPAFYIFDNLNGTISGWSKGSTGGLTQAVVVVDTPGSMYKGLAMGQIGAAWTLYAADATPMGGIKVFNSDFKPLQLGSKAFMDPDLPSLPSDAGLVWTTFNVENLGGNIFVTYAPIPVTGGHPILNSDAGVVAEFTPEGKFMRNVIVTPWGTPNRLDDPWALEMAPQNFGAFSNDLLVGNFGSGEILAYKPTMNGMFTFEGIMDGSNGKPIMDGRLWDLSFGNGANGANPDTLYIATGGPNPKKDGLFAAISPTKP